MRAVETDRMFHARTLPTSDSAELMHAYRVGRSTGAALTSASWEDAECYTSDRADVLRLRSFLSLGRFEFDLLVLIQRSVTGARDRGEVHEHIRRPVIGGDETKALVGVEPLHCEGYSKGLIIAGNTPRTISAST